MKQILPALIMWAGNQPDPWIIADQDLAGVLRAIIACIVPHFWDLSMICPGTVIFNLVFGILVYDQSELTSRSWQATRCLSLWCSNFGSSGIGLIAHFLSPGINTPQDPPPAQETCLDLLDGFSFLYHNLDSSNPANAYRSHFVLQLLTHAHIHLCVGCPNIQSIDTDTLKHHGIKGAISLSCAAVHKYFYTIKQTLNDSFSLNKQFICSNVVI